MTIHNKTPISASTYTKTASKRTKKSERSVPLTVSTSTVPAKPIEKIVQDPKISKKKSLQLNLPDPQVLEKPLSEENESDSQNNARDKTRSKSLEKLREELLKRRNFIRRSRNDSDISDKESIAQVGDSADAALESAENELEYHFFEIESREFGQIERALQRFEDGTYGNCESCGAPIPIARLKVLPFACKCVKCQQMDEEEQNRSSFRGWKSYDYSLAQPSNDFVLTERELD